MTQKQLNLNRLPWEKFGVSLGSCCIAAHLCSGVGSGAGAGRGGAGEQCSKWKQSRLASSELNHSLAAFPLGASTFVT